MYYEFYIDQFFIEQLIVGYLLLIPAAALCRITPSHRRRVLGSLTGAVCMTAFVWLGRPYLYVLVPPAAAAAAFWKPHLVVEWRYNLRCTLGLLAATTCFGGVLEALTQLLLLPVMAAVVPASVLVCLLLRFIKRRSQKLEQTAAVTFCLDGRSLTLEGFLDTGNQLTEPLTGQPVSIAQEKALESLLGRDWEERKGFCLIPYHSLGTDSGWMRAVTFDEMSVMMRRGGRVFRQPMIALYNGRVSIREEYQVILHPEHSP